MYYGLIILSTFMFSGCFLMNDSYRKIQGSSIYISIRYMLISSIAGLIVLSAISGFKFAFTPFTLIMALLTVLNGFGFTYCSFKSLGMINLSVYSLYSMLGGMLLPFLLGVLFYNESFTFAKLLCLVFISVALLLTVKKGDNKGGLIYYLGIFILNGMAGVLSKIFASAPFPKTDAASYSILCAVCNIVVAGIILLFFKGENKASKETPMSLFFAVASGVTNRVANYILVLALLYVDASVQYPLVTGGTMILSTLMCYLRKEKPTIKEILAVVFAFAGMLTLFLFKM